MNELITVDRVSKRHRRPRQSLSRPAPVVDALRGVSLRIERGQRFGIVGESGSGKTTLLKIIAGLDQPSSGAVSIAGQQVTGRSENHLKELRRTLQLIFQDPAGSLDPRMRVGDIVAEPLINGDSSERSARVEELLDQVGLPADAARRYPHQFSGGQRQRISIARALAPRPEILLADEPVSALDVSVRSQVLDLMSGLVDRLGLTLVFVSHDLSVVRHVCDEMAVMRDGEVVEKGAVEEIWQAPQARYTQELITAVPTISRALHGGGPAELLITGSGNDSKRR